MDSPTSQDTGIFPRPALLLCLLAVAVILAYANSLNTPFVFDDYGNIVGNSQLEIKSLGIKNLAEAASSGPSGNRWLPNLSFALNYYFNGLEVRGYHLVNLAVHIMAAAAFYLLAMTTLTLPTIGIGPGRAAEIAFAAALLWAVHPVQTNAVTYIVQRMTAMAALFYLTALLCYVKARLQPMAAKKYLLYALCITAGGMAMLSKENSAILPLTIIGYEFLILRDFNSKNIKKAAVLLAISALLIILLGTVYMQGNPLDAIMAGYAERNFSLTERLLTQPRVIFFYISLLILPLPARLNLNHDIILSTGLFSPPQTILAITGMALLVLLIFLLAVKKHRLAAFAVFWFLANLLIESSVIALELVYEHRLYLPALFPILALTVLAYRQLADRQNLLRTILAVAAMLLIFMTWQRNNTWQSELSLWTDVVNKSPRLVRGYGNLGHIHEKQGKLQKAEKLLQQALHQDQANIKAGLRSAGRGDLAKVHDNLGIVYRRLDSYQNALYHAKQAYSLDTGLLNPLLTLGIIYEKLGDNRKALTFYEKAREKGLDTVHLYNNWGIAYFNLGSTDKAVELFHKALELAPNHSESHYNLGIAYSSLGMMQEAGREMSLGLQLKNKTAP